MGHLSFCEAQMDGGLAHFWVSKIGGEEINQFRQVDSSPLYGRKIKLSNVSFI